MKSFAVSLSIVVCLAAAWTPSAEAADWGTLKGKFVLDGKAPSLDKLKIDKDLEVCGKHEVPNEGIVVGADGGLANVFVFVRTKDVAVAPEYAKTEKEKVVLNNKNCRFEPHCLVMRTTQTLELKNSDQVGHNTKADIPNASFNTLLPIGASVDQTISGEQTIPAQYGCNIHPWMGGWILVRKDPYAAVSKESGEFEIKDAPADKELEFQFWQENVGYLKDVAFKGGKADTKGRFKLKLKAGDNDLGDIKVPAKLFKK